MLCLSRCRFRASTIALFAMLPAVTLAQNHQNLSVPTMKTNSGSSSEGINPDYSLPDYPTAKPVPRASLMDSSSPDPARSSASPSGLPSNQIPGEDREVSWRKLPLNVLHDQKDMWLFPLQLARGRHWLPALFITGGTAAFLATDPQVEPHFRQTTNFHSFNRAFSSTNTGAAIVVVPAVFYAASLWRKNSYDQSSALFAGEALVDDLVLITVTKAITRRQRPTELPVAGPYNDTFFHSNGSIFGKGTSFPSGHAMLAISVATVFARRYHDHRWVPFVAYAAAGAIAFSRVTTGSHFPADAFFGSSMGYVIARYDVLRGQ